MNDNKLLETCDLLVSKVEEARSELQKLRNHLDDLLKEVQDEKICNIL